MERRSIYKKVTSRNAYTGKSNDFRSEAEQNTFLNENQRSLPSLPVAQMLEHMLRNLAGLDISDPPAEISRVCNLSCPIFPSKHHESLKGK